MNDTIYRQAAIDALGDKPLAWTEGEYELGLQNQWQSDVDALKELPSAQPEQIARDIATIIENEQDMRVLNAPSAQPEIPEIIRCKDCKYAEVADKEDRQDGYTCQFHRGSIWFSGSYCSWAERRQDADSSGNMSGTQKELKCTETHSCDYQRTETHDLVSRQSAIDSVCEVCEYCEYFKNEKLIQTIKDLPPAQPRWIPVTLETLPNLNSVVVVCGKKGTWDYGTYRGWSGDIHSWQWKKNTIKHVYWWMYKADALQEPYKEGQE